MGLNGWGLTPWQLTHDGILNNRLRLWQPAKSSHGYRFNSDSVLLAAAVPATAGQTVLELGSGVGAAALSLAYRVPDILLLAVEINPELARLGTRNASENGLANAVKTIVADAAALPLHPNPPMLDHIMLNPPYYESSRERLGRAPQARFQPPEKPLRQWLTPAVACLKTNGSLTMIYPANRVAEGLDALPADLGKIQILPLLSHPDQPPKRLLIHAQKLANPGDPPTAPHYHSGLLLHQADGGFTAEAKHLLREAGGLNWR